MKPVFATTSVREHMSTQDNSNIKMGRPVTGDFTGLKSKDGYVTITGKREGRSYVWIAVCSKENCRCTGIAFPHEFLVNGGEIECPNRGAHTAAATPTARRQFSAQPGDSFALKPGAGSVRDRLQAQQRDEEIKSFEGGQQ
jgi:hypothetical protein